MTKFGELGLRAVNQLRKITWFRPLFKNGRFSRNLSPLLIFGLVFGFALLRCRIAFSTGEYGVTTSMQFSQARQTLGGLDAGSYLQGAMSLHDSSFRNTTNQFIWELWPPGLPLFEAILILVFGLGAKPLILLAITDSLLLATSTALLWVESSYLRRKKFTFILLTLFLLSSLVQGWLLDQGIMYAEGFFVFLLTMSTINLAKFEKTKNYRYLYQSGVLLGMAAYFRAVGFTCIEIIFLGALAMTGIALVSKSRKKESSKTHFRLAIDLLKYGLVALVVTLPWSLFRATWLHLNPVQWVVTGDSTWKVAWQTDSQLDKSGLGITKGIDNWACHLDQIKCNLLSSAKNPQYFSQAIHVIINHPFDFLWMRITAFWHYWSLNGRWLYPQQNHLPVAFAYLEGLTSLLIVFVAVFLLFCSLSKKPHFAILSICTIFGTTLPLLVFHLESRYFIPIKVLAVAILILHPKAPNTLMRMKKKTSTTLAISNGNHKVG